jgi:hypothetical protein
MPQHKNRKKGRDIRFEWASNPRSQYFRGWKHRIALNRGDSVFDTRKSLQFLSRDRVRFDAAGEPTVEISILEYEKHTKLHATIASCKSFHVRDGKYFRTVWTEDKGHVHTFLQRCHSQTKHLTRVFGNITSYHGHFNLRKQINIPLA